MQHIIYCMKTMLREKALLFWSLAFPIILGILFYVMFGSINEQEQFSEVPVGIINAEENRQLVTTMKKIKNDGTQMFRITEYENQDAAMQALEDEKIKGIVDAAKQDHLVVRKSDVYASFIKVFLDQYKQNAALIEKLARKDPERALRVLSLLSEGKSDISISSIDLNGVEKDPYVQYFYALIAMTCLIGTMVGINNGVAIEANLSPAAARRNVSPTPKIWQVLRDFIATYVVYCAIISIVIAVCVFVFHQDFGENVFLILLGGYVGSFTAIAIGMLIAVFVKASLGVKQGICTLVFMGSSFLAGLQWVTITYVLEQKCPIINRLNLATLIVNGYKSLAVFGDFRQYAYNMLTLFAIGAVCVIACIGKLRRERYASL